jgi:hypothetical protein
MKGQLLPLFLAGSIPCFSQRIIPTETFQRLEARMIDGKSSVFLVDSLYNDYKTVGPFDIQDRKNLMHSDDGGSWLLNMYVKLGREYPKQCSECKDKATKMMLLIDEEINIEKEIQYQRIIKKADDCFQQKDFLKAKEYYQRAVTFRPSDPYPKQKLKEIDEICSKQPETK